VLVSIWTKGQQDMNKFSDLFNYQKRRADAQAKLAAQRRRGDLQQEAEPSSSALPVEP